MKITIEFNNIEEYVAFKKSTTQDVEFQEQLLKIEAEKIAINAISESLSKAVHDSF